MNKKEVQEIINKLKANTITYAKTERYYKGDHDLAFASKKFKNAFGELFREFALNLCPAVCDAVKDKLRITNFNVEKGKEKIAAEAWKLWQSNRMGKRSSEVHKEALKNGDAYLMVWVDSQKKVTFYPQKAVNCTVIYDEETPGKIRLAGKTWLDQDKKARLYIYYPDRTERYISKSKADGGLPNAESFVEYSADGITANIPNKYNRVPVFHFANNSDIGSFGISELAPAMPIQDGLNKTVLDMLVAMEFTSFPQRYATGIEVDYDEEGKAIPPFKPGIDRLIYTENPDAKFGSLEMGDLEQFLKVKADFKIDMAGVTGTPLYYWMLTSGEIPSGESLKKSETRFIHKVNDRQETFGQIWEDAVSFGLLMDGKKDVQLFTDWEDPAPLSEKEKLENIRTKQEIGISDEQALIEAGYGEADIERMMKQKAEKRESEIRSFNAGEDLEDSDEI